MNINWKLRIKNPATCSTLLVAVIAFVYQTLGAFNVVPPISENEVTNIMAIIVNVLSAMGILVDPTTKGVSDSERAMGYNEPN